MTRRGFLSVIAVASLALPISACKSADKPRPTTLPALGPIEYRRTGGFAGTNDRISVAADGTIRTSGKLLGEREGKLADARRRQLAVAVSDWPTYKAEYPPPRNTADAFVVTITYNGKSVTATDASEGVPDLFGLVRDILEGAANDLPRKQG